MRPFIAQPDIDLNEFDFIPANNYKKMKLDTNSEMTNMLGCSPSEYKRNAHLEQYRLSSQPYPQNVITIEDDNDEDCLIIDNLSTKTQNLVQPKDNFPFELKGDLIQPSSFLNPSRSLVQNLKFWDALPLPENLFFQQINIQNSTSEPEINHLQFAKESNITAMEDDNADQLTCGSTPETREDTCSVSLELQSQQISDKFSDITSEFVQESSVIQVSEKEMQYATLPPFKLSAVNSRQRKVKKINPVWTPTSLVPGTFENWVSQIGRAVGLEITNEEKVITTMKNFDMNIEVALEKIKRNKAQYKDYFRVKKLPKKQCL